MRLRFHCQTAAATLTKPQYRINVVRTALQALSAVLGGCQSLHTNGYDEAFAIPTEDAMRLALRTQQIIAEEINVTSVVDPARRIVFRRKPDQRVREAHFRDSRLCRGQRRHDQADRGRLVPEADRGFRLRNRAAQAERREAGHRRQPLYRRGGGARRRDAPLRSADRGAPDRAHQARSRRAGRRQADRAAWKSSSRWPRTTGRTSCRSPSRWSRTARPWARSSTP